MRFNVRDRVKITEDADFGDDHVTKGTRGTVTQVLPLSQAYRVKFDSMTRNVIVLDAVLEPA